MGNGEWGCGVMKEDIGMGIWGNDRMKTWEWDMGSRQNEDMGMGHYLVLVPQLSCIPVLFPPPCCHVPPPPLFHLSGSLQYRRQGQFNPILTKVIFIYLCSQHSLRELDQSTSVFWECLVWYLWQHQCL